MGIALVASFCLVFVVAVAGKSPRFDAQVACRAQGHEAASFADPSGDGVFLVFVHVVPTAGKHDDIVRIPVHPVQSTHRGHGVIPNLLKREPHLPKTQRGHLVAHHHRHARGVDGGHVVGPKVGAGGHHAALQARHGHARHVRRQIGQARGHVWPKGFVVASGDDNRPSRERGAVDFDRALHHTCRHAGFEQVREHGRAEVGVVVKHIRVGRSFAVK